MQGNNDLLISVKVDADQAIRKLADVSEAETKMAHATEVAGEKAKDASKSNEQMSESLSSITLSVGAFLASGASLLALYDQIIDRAKKAAEANRDLGQTMQGLAANVGGGNADDVTRDAFRIAIDSGFDKAGATQLVDFAAAATDVRPNMSRDDIYKLNQQGALMQRATGLGGKAGFDVIQALTTNLNMTDAQAVDFATGLLNSGHDPASIIDMASKGADERLLATVYASRDRISGDIGGRQLNALLGAVRMTDEEGNLAPGLTAAGVTADMQPFDRLQQLYRARDEGGISQAQFYKLTGGQSVEQLMRAIDPVMRNPGAIQSAVAELRDPDLAEGEVAKKLQSASVRSMERQNRAKLSVEVESLYGSLSGLGEAAIHTEAEYEREGIPGIVKSAGDYMGFNALHAWLNSDEAGLEKLDSQNRASVEQALGARYKIAPPPAWSPAGRGMIPNISPGREDAIGQQAGEVTNIQIVNYINSNVATSDSSKAHPMRSVQE